MEKQNTDVPEDSGADSLDDLLDSSLSDFDKPIPQTVHSKNEDTKASTSSKSSTAADAKSTLDSSEWTEEFNKVMENFLEGEPELKEFKDFMGNLQSQAGALNDPNNLAESFAETIKGLTEGAQNIPPPTPEEMASLFNNLNIPDVGNADGDAIPDLMPLMHSVMQQLMSKELLYPSIKEITDKYPKWLEDNQASLDKEKYENYNQQLMFMKKVCDEFENDCDDSEDAKRTRFERVLSLMQRIQNYGNPPKEILGDIERELPLDEHGNLQLPGMPQQCIVM